MAAAADTKAFTSRKVGMKVLSKEQMEGMGARVRRSIGNRELRNLDPFLLLDEFKFAAPAGGPDHPHRGFETVTYLFPWSKSEIVHEDFAGHKGKVGAGDLQWMTAGRGIVHAEMPADPDNKGIAHGLQLWVNLSGKDKLVEPAYQELKAADIPHVTKDGVTAIVIAGEALGVKSKIYTRTPVHYLHIQMEKGAVLHHPIPAGFNAFAYTIEGDPYFGQENKPVAPHHTVVLERDADADGITVRTPDGPAQFVLLAGRPSNEPIVQYGPFVMTSQAEIMKAFEDYRSGQNGFERAREWRSEIAGHLLD